MKIELLVGLYWGMKETGASDAEDNITEESSLIDHSTMAIIELHKTSDICQEFKVEMAPSSSTEVWWLSSF